MCSTSQCHSFLIDQRIHGGSFISGSATGPGLDGTNLAKATNSIVAVVQYRLGAVSQFRACLFVILRRLLSARLQLPRREHELRSAGHYHFPAVLAESGPQLWGRRLKNHRRRSEQWGEFDTSDTRCPVSHVAFPISYPPLRSNGKRAPRFLSLVVTGRGRILAFCLPASNLNFKIISTSK